jgi:hypothetical protein
MTTAPPVVFIPVYEFTAKQNAIVRHLASRMRAVGTGLIVITALLVLRAVLGSVEFGTLIWIGAAVLGCIGFWSVRAGIELQRVVRTEGTDIPYLMRALTEIRKLYDLQYWVLVALALLAAFTVLVAIAGRGLPAAW